MSHYLALRVSLWVAPREKGALGTRPNLSRQKRINYGTHRERAEEVLVDRGSGAHVPKARSQRVGGTLLAERADEAEHMSLITDPVAKITEGSGRGEVFFWCFKPDEEMGGRTAGRKAGCTRAALSVHTKTPLYAYACSSLHTRPAMIIAYSSLHASLRQAARRGYIYRSSTSTTLLPTTEMSIGFISICSTGDVESHRAHIGYKEHARPIAVTFPEILEFFHAPF
jgi:hypothetical protein